MSGEGCFTCPIHVAVCDTPAGKYEYYGAVRTPDGKELSRYITFDPAVINDDGKIWLYYGWSLEKEGLTKENINKDQLKMVEMKLFGKTEEELRVAPYSTIGYKYFAFNGSKMLTLRLRGNASGKLRITADNIALGELLLAPMADWTDCSLEITVEGVHALYLYFSGEGSLDFEQLL